jgi:hypothetical protein
MKLDITIVFNNENRQTKTFYPTDLENCRDILTNYIVTIINTTINFLDFPSDVYEFENIWFDYNYINSTFYTYKIDDVESEIWDYQEIYDEVLEKLLELEYNFAPNFNDLYHDEEEGDIESQYINEPTEEYYNNALNKIDEVEECNCNKCVVSLI